MLSSPPLIFWILANWKKKRMSEEEGQNPLHLSWIICKFSFIVNAFAQMQLKHQVLCLPRAVLIDSTNFSLWICIYCNCLIFTLWWPLVTLQFDLWKSLSTQALRQPALTGEITSNDGSYTSWHLLDPEERHGFLPEVHLLYSLCDYCALNKLSEWPYCCVTGYCCLPQLSLGT